jgi:chemotaxis protein MotB
MRATRNGRRRGPEADEDQRDRWLVSYADLVTLLFAFFVVMYAISQVNEAKYRVLSDALSSAFQIGGRTPGAVAPGGALIGLERGGAPQPIRGALTDPAGGARHPQLQTTRTELDQVLAPLVEKGDVQVIETQRGIVIEINAGVLFRAGQATLEPDAIRPMAEFGRLLARTPNAIEVEGHTDSTPIATAAFPTNWELSAARAAAVVRLFIDNGVLGWRLMAAGYADNRPVASNDTAEGRARNRRVTITVLADAPQPGALPARPPGAPR